MAPVRSTSPSSFFTLKAALFAFTPEPASVIVPETLIATIFLFGDRTTVAVANSLMTGGVVSAALFSSTTFTEKGFWPAANGEPGTGVSSPELLFTVYADKLLEVMNALAAYTNLPDGSTATDQGAIPAAKGLPGTGLRAPVLALIE
jgi:hypothetical protein